MSELGGAYLGARPVAAAFAIGLSAYHAGQDIKAAIEAAGFSAALAQSTYNKITESHFTTVEMSNKRSKIVPDPAPRRSTIPVAPSVKKYVKRCMDHVVEKKHYTSNGSGALVTTGAIYPCGLYSIVQGDTGSTREGNKIHLKEMRLTYNLTTTGVVGVARVMVVWDRQSNGGVFATSDVLDSSTTLAPYNHQNVVGAGGSRFTVIYDKLHDCNARETSAAVFTQAMTFTRKFTKSVQRMIEYDANAGAITDLVSNNLQICVIGTSTSITFGFQCDLEFVDN